MTFHQDKHKKAKGPTQLSKFFNTKKSGSSHSESASGSSSDDDDDKGPRSVISGKRIKLKVKKDRQDKIRDRNREQLLHFYNNMYE